jgi:DNA mismatch repair protein MutS
LYQIENEGHLSPNPTGDPIQQKKAEGAAVQIEMFQPLEKSIFERLKSLDVTRMTPLEALNVLDEICTKSRSGSD